MGDSHESGRSQQRGFHRYGRQDLDRDESDNDLEEGSDQDHIREDGEDQSRSEGYEEAKESTSRGENDKESRSSTKNQGPSKKGQRQSSKTGNAIDDEQNDVRVVKDKVVYEEIEGDKLSGYRKSFRHET